MYTNTHSRVTVLDGKTDCFNKEAGDLQRGTQARSGP